MRRFFLFILILFGINFSLVVKANGDMYETTINLDNGLTVTATVKTIDSGIDVFEREKEDIETFVTILNQLNMPSYDISNIDESWFVNSETYYNICNNDYLTKLANPTDLYNCHSYAWYYKGLVSYTNPIVNNYWIDDPENFIVDRYIEIDLDDAQPNDILTYWQGNNLTHSAIVSSTTSDFYIDGAVFNLIVRSKWGTGWLAEHRASICDYYRSDTTLKVYRSNSHVHIAKRYINETAYCHYGTCIGCQAFFREAHSFYILNNKYYCWDCNYESASRPIIQNGITYYIFASDKSQKLYTYDEMHILLELERLMISK